ncbi:hypothetical protein PRIPAC_86209 [Pristionchus pacificus]|uniref:Uncharacterized protein n=1 Tax=Pristionchus pacificus TaxID=54126 RepID=A0A2A6BSB7_PRIPA|nr:hypothetical protein PRIPAC_86209 [Pristionchus pacificus]|eukprot:PDM68716.1 hypothetical protein PRIPAC_47018 [Pristionchus pacificus]
MVDLDDVNTRRARLQNAARDPARTRTDLTGGVRTNSRGNSQLLAHGTDAQPAPAGALHADRSSGQLLLENNNNK